MLSEYATTRMDHWNYDEEKIRLGSPFMVDTYHPWQLAIYWRLGGEKVQVVHDYFARTPVLGSYLFITGLERVLKHVKNLRFTEEEIADFRAAFPNLASEDFLEYLREFRFRGDIWAVPEGQLVFGQNEPILKVRSNLLEGWILETIILSIMNGDIAYATNATHFVKSARGRPVIDFGLRRARGDGGKISATRSAYVGGVVATSNVQAALNLDIPQAGTMSHEAIQFGTLIYGSEKEAFKDYIREAVALGADLVLLVDTFESVQGARNALMALREISDELGRKIKAKAFRIDSGDLYAQAERIRALDPQREWFDGIFLTNDLDPVKIAAIVEKDRGKNLISGFGAGTKLLNPPQVVGGVYKLCAVRRDGIWEPSVKVSDSPEKTTLGGDKTIFRLYDEEGDFTKDVLCLAGEKKPQDNCFELLEKVMENGNILMAPVPLDEIQRFGQSNLNRLPAEYKDYQGQALFPIELSPKLRALQEEALAKNACRMEECLYA